MQTQMYIIHARIPKIVLLLDQLSHITQCQMKHHNL